MIALIAVKLELLIMSVSRFVFLI